MRISDWSSDVCSSDLEYESARLQEGSLEAQVDRLKSATLSEQDRSVRYNILAREADTNRTLYDGLLQRYKEVSAAAGITASNVSVVDAAAVPNDPSSPELPLNMATAATAGGEDSTGGGRGAA